MQKALTQMNVMLYIVVCDLTGVTGLKIVRTIVAGEPASSRCWFIKLCPATSFIPTQVHLRISKSTALVN